MNKLHELIKLNLGNQNQYVSIHTENTDKPILLFLHGGPGSAQIGFIRYYNKPLESEFIVVNWDQKGSGKSYSSGIEAATMTIDQFVLDTIELTEYLIKRFDKQKIYLCGHSWGTILGIKTITKRPELFEAYIGIGQVVNMIEGEKISRQYSFQSALENNNKKALKELDSIGLPPYKDIKSLFTSRKWLEFYGGATYQSGPIRLILKGISLKEYNIWDWVYKFIKGSMFSIKLLIAEMYKVNLDKTNLEFNVPIYFFLGKKDYQVPSELAIKYFDQIKAP